MKHRHFTQAARRLTALTLALLLALPSAYAAAGSPQLRTTRELADGLTYSNTITSHSAAGRVESFSLELSPDSREVEPIFLQASGTAYGAGSINLAVSYAQSLGYHVLGAINTGSTKKRGDLWYNVGRYVYVPLAIILCCVALFMHVAF